MAKPNNKCEIEQAKEIIKGSGNNFHCKVLKYLQEKEWNVLISPYYNDNISNKPREIDLIAEKEFDVYKFSWPAGKIKIRLFIECKFIPSVNVLWFHKKDNKKAEELIKNTIRARDINIYTNKHHYFSEKNEVAKLFAASPSKETENEAFYKAINQSINSMIYYRDDLSLADMSKHYKVIFNYPIIACNNFDRLYRVNIGEVDEPVKIDDNFLLEVNYAYINKANNHDNEYFLIDVIDFEKIDSFLECIEQDVKFINNFLPD